LPARLPEIAPVTSPSNCASLASPYNPGGFSHWQII
jgi:hypothetical protein